MQNTGRGNNMKNAILGIIILLITTQFNPSVAGEGHFIRGIVEQFSQMLRDKELAAELGEKFVKTEQRLFKVSSSIFEGDTRFLSVEVDNNDRIVGLKLTSKKESDRRFNVGNINSGITLLRKSGKDVIILFGEDFDLNSGGWAKVQYLVNGVTGSKSHFWVKMELGGDGAWKAFYKGNRIWNATFIPSKVTFFGVVGVKEVNFSYY